MTLTLDFEGQIMKMMYLRNGMADWHGTKGMWVDRMLHTLCDFQLWPQPWPWPWIFKVKFWKSHISGMGWPIDMEWKGCESIECWTCVMTFNVPLTHDLDLGLWRSNYRGPAVPLFSCISCIFLYSDLPPVFSCITIKNAANSCFFLYFWKWLEQVPMSFFRTNVNLL